MNDYSFKAKKQHKADLVLSISFYLSAAVLYGFPLFIDGIKYVPIMQFLALICIVAGLYVNYRYTLTGFVYSLRLRGDKYYFCVYKTVGNRSTLAAELPACECVKITRHLPKKYRAVSDLDTEVGKSGIVSDDALAAYSSPDRYIFTTTLRPPVYYTAVFRHAGVYIFIRFEPDSTLLSLLCEHKNEITSE